MALGLWTLWAALAAMAAAFVVGFLWYGPVFGKPYMRLTGMDKLSAEDQKRMQQEAMPGYATNLVSTGIATVIVAFLFDWAFAGSGYASKAVFGISLGTAGWAAFYAPGTLTNSFFDRKPKALWALNAGYWLVVAVAMGLFVGIFHGM
jgi:hypothetical protein